jgi:hypothetical protein
MNNMDSAPTLLRNVVRSGNHWLELRLTGGAKSPRDAIGAKVFVTANGIRRRADVISGGSYASSSDLRVHFGLGSAKSASLIEIRWPSGAVERLRDVAVDRILTIREGEAAAK